MSIEDAPAMSISYSTLATSALGFTIALAWNDAISKTIMSLFPSTSKESAIKALIAYAVVVTIFVILVVVVVNHTRKLVHKVVGFTQREVEKSTLTSGPIVRLWEPTAAPPVALRG